MYNNVVVIGNVIQKPKLFETNNGYKMGSMIVRVKRSYRNASGEFDEDDFEVILWKNIADECIKNVPTNSLVVVSGRLQAINYNKDTKTYYKANIVAERVSIVNS